MRPAEPIEEWTAAVGAAAAAGMVCKDALRARGPIMSLFVHTPIAAP